MLSFNADNITISEIHENILVYALTESQINELFVFTTEKKLHLLTFVIFIT
jgi:hypothetical protein